MDERRRMLNDIAEEIRQSGEEVLSRYSVSRDREHVLTDLIEAELVRGERGSVAFEAVSYRNVRLTDRGLKEAGA